jgi:hypothetical protein
MRPAAASLAMVAAYMSLLLQDLPNPVKIEFGNKQHLVARKGGEVKVGSLSLDSYKPKQFGTGGSQGGVMGGKWPLRELSPRRSNLTLVFLT